MDHSLWAAYKAEVSDLTVIEHEWGFASYAIAPDCIFIDEFYVKPGRRCEGNGRELIEQLRAAARMHDKRYLKNTVNLSNKTAALSLKAQLAVGFVPIRAYNDTILMLLEVENG